MQTTGLTTPCAKCSAVGSLRDLYVLGGGLVDWEGLLRIARASAVRSQLDGVDQPLPMTAAETLALRDIGAPFISIDWERIRLNIHFFGVVDVEIDLDPGSIDFAGRFEALIRFMRRLAAEAGQPTVLTPENWRDWPYLEVSPSGDAVVVRPDGVPSFRWVAGEGSRSPPRSRGVSAAPPATPCTTNPRPLLLRYP